jgi:hypothetical protein
MYEVQGIDKSGSPYDVRVIAVVGHEGGRVQLRVPLEYPNRCEGIWAVSSEENPTIRLRGWGASWSSVGAEAQNIKSLTLSKKK